MKATRIIAFLVALTLIVLSAGMSWAVAEDYAERDIVPEGAVALGVEGQDPVELGGLTTAEAKAKVKREIVEPLLADGVIDGGPVGKHTFEPVSFADVDVDKMVEEAKSPWLASTFPERVARRVADKPMRTEVPLALTVHEDKLLGWAARLEHKVGRSAVDSTMTVHPDGKIFISQSRLGYSIDRRATFAALKKALVENKHEVKLGVTVIKPVKTRENWGNTIVVVRKQRHVWFYDGMKVAFDAEVAVGTPGHPTPLGKWKIEDKVKNPAWHNPHAAWSAGMPEYISPGPSNPLGTRALYLDAAGIRFHGTSNNSSVGTAASHGCMRMHRWDIEKWYPMVKVGTPVYILR